jgi:hypothetical protein
METTRIIEQYLEGTLGAEERKATEERAASDKVFNELIMLHKEVNESIRDKDFHSFRLLLDKVSDENLGKTISIRQKGFKFYLLRIAAAVILVLAAGITIRYALFQQINAEKLFLKYYESYDADAISRSGISDEQNLNQAMISYEQKDFEIAIVLLDKILAENRDHYMARFYKGLVLLETDSPAEAIESFKAIPNVWDSAYSEHRDWYLAMALLRNNNIAEANSILRKINAENGYYAKKAKKVSSKLNS